MLTNTKMAILETIKNSSENLDPNYFWSSPALISACLEKLYDFELSPATVSKHLKQLRIDGYITSAWRSRFSAGFVADKKAPNLKLTARGTEYLQLCKSDQTIHR